MQQLELFLSIAEQYKKYDFKIERCLMTVATIESLRVARAQTDSFLGVAVEIAELDAIWFSRPSAGNTVAWEIRLVSPTPLSLLEKIPDGAADADREQKLEEMETRLLDLISHRKAEIEEIIADNAGAPDDEDDEGDLDEEELNDSRSDSKKKGNGRFNN
jgi:hypothetical protein